MRDFIRAIACAASILASCAATAQTTDKGGPDPVAVLAAAKAASGGAAWDGLKFQHSLVALMTGGISGEAERWCEIATGRSYMRFAIGQSSGAMGYDGAAPWSQDPAGKAHVGTDEAESQLAANAAYRDQLAFWYPTRHAASIAYRSRSSADGATFDVIAITPVGGREFDFWINTDTNLIERMVEREANATRTEIYMDWKDVQGVKIPFRVRVLRGDPKADELVVVERIEYDGPPTGISFARPE